MKIILLALIVLVAVPAAGLAFIAIPFALAVWTGQMGVFVIAFVVMVSAAIYACENWS